MTKIYEALQQASRERTRAVESSPVPATPVVPQNELDASLLAACNRVDTLLGRHTSQVVAVMGVPRGDDASKMVNLLARAAARYLGRKVLIVRTDNRGGRTRQSAALPNAAPSPEEHTLDASLLTAPRSDALNSLMTEWRDAFDVVLVDLSYDGARGEEVLCALTDGVVLIVEAEKARWQAIKHKIDLIGALNGRVLGTILNKQRRYIPDFLYKRL